VRVPELAGRCRLGRRRSIGAARHDSEDSTIRERAGSAGKGSFKSGKGERRAIEAEEKVSSFLRWRIMARRKICQYKESKETKAAKMHKQISAAYLHLTNIWIVE